MEFPAGFRFGVATASYQIEGASAEGGRTPSIWDTFSHTPGKIAHDDNGDQAVDHYHRWAEDVALMQELGIDSYRLSISWSRLIPHGRGEANREGIAFYRTLLQALRDADIRPAVTLYHWDLPQELQDEGGWTRRGIIDDFEHYARVAAQELGDLVDMWITLNEPWCTAFLGYASGVHAPGISDPASALISAHHLNVAHGRAVVALREELGEDTTVSVSLNLHVTRPQNADDDSHLDAVRRIDQVGNHIFLGPMLEGSYPTALIADTRHITDWSFVQPGDLHTARQRLDVLGVNYYSTNVVRPKVGNGPALSGGHGEGAASPWVGADHVEFLPPEGPLTDMGWNIDPDGLYDLLAAIDRVYPGMPIMVTENGAAFPDLLTEGRVEDPARIDYLTKHLSIVSDAIHTGIDVQGYFLWSFLDNFEWAWGYDKRFGIVYVNYETFERTPKDSFTWYKDFISTHRQEQQADSEAIEERKPRRSLWEWIRR